jgi:hypothetical protein
MKWISLLPILALALLINACEQHPATDSPGEEVHAFGKPESAAAEKAEPQPDQPGKKSEAKPAEAAATPAATAKPGEAPKYFPENK